jgi:hypothetical protein
MAFKKEIIEIIEPRDVFVGPDTAPVTLMEFGEYENEDCAKAHEVVKKIMEEFKGKVRFNFRHFPLTKIHQRSLKMVRHLSLPRKKILGMLVFCFTRLNRELQFQLHSGSGYFE